MNDIRWVGDETVEDLYPLWIWLVENGNRAGLIKELAAAVNGNTVYKREGDSYVYVGPDYDSDEMIILELSYGDDANKITEMVAESDDHEVGENLK